MTPYSPNSERSISPMSTSSTLWQEMLPGENGKLISELLEKQYDVIYGSWPTEYNEIVLVADSNNEVDDMALYALGLKSKEDIDALALDAYNDACRPGNPREVSVEDIIAIYRSLM